LLSTYLGGAGTDYGLAAATSGTSLFVVGQTDSSNFLTPVLMWKYGTWPDGWQVLTAPLFMLLAVVTVLGISLLLAAVNVRYRDVRYMIPVFLQVLPLLSGVMFAVDQIPEKWQWILSFNPMTSVISGWRWAMLGASPPAPGQVAVGVAVALTLFVIGLAVFRSSEPRFADTI